MRKNNGSCFLRLTGGGVFLTVAVACSTAPIPLEAKSSGLRTYDKHIYESVQVDYVKDRRPKNAQLSDLGGRPMTGADVVGWFDKALRLRHFQLDNHQSNQAVKCKIGIEIRQAELSANNTSKTANVVLGVRNMQNGTYKILRGSSVSINWINGRGETNSALSRALDDSLAKLGSVCPEITGS